MEKLFTCKIDNLIQNYCYNFLSYLYVAAGWKRIIFETSKENYIASNVSGRKIRIVISNVGSILLTGYCFTDLLTGIEYLISQFEYGRMGYYIVLNDKFSIKWVMTETFPDGTVIKYDTCEARKKLIKDIKESRKKLRKDKKLKSVEHIEIYIDEDIAEEMLDEEAIVEEEKIFNPFSFFSTINFADYF